MFKPNDFVLFFLSIKNGTGLNKAVLHVSEITVAKHGVPTTAMRNTFSV